MTTKTHSESVNAIFWAVLGKQQDRMTKIANKPALLMPATSLTLSL